MSWEQLLDIYRTAGQVTQEQVSASLVDCPLCGKPLTQTPSGSPHCTFDGWQPGLGPDTTQPGL